MTPMLTATLLGIAADYYLEAGPYPTKAEATAAAQGLHDDAFTRVVRRFRSGSGWEYVVRIGGFDDEHAMRAYGAKASGLPLSSYERVGATWRRLDGKEGAAPEEDLVIEPGRTLRTPVLIKAAVKAHGGHEGGLAVLELAPTVVFDYERTVHREGGSTVAEHHYVRMGEAIRLDVDVKSGPGVDSHTILDPSRRAWVSTDATSIARDPERTAEVLARFSPEGLLAVPLGIPHDMETSGPWRLLAPTASIDGKRVIAKAEAPGDRGLVSAEFGVDDHLLRRLDWMLDTGPITYEFDDYETVAEGLVVPFKYRVLREGELVESMTVHRLELGKALPADAFLIPEAPAARP